MSDLATDRNDRMRRALGACSFLPYTAAKRFARQVCGAPVETVTDAQWWTVIVIAHRFRRQMPRDLVPSVLELHRAKAGLEARAVQRAAERDAKIAAKAANATRRKGVEPGAPLFDQVGERA